MTLDVVRNYEVGYGKPPERTQWVKGQSGNPKGRPRKQPANRQRSFQPFLDMMLQEMDRPVIACDGDEVSAIRAVVRSAIASAMQGDVRAQKICIELNKYVQEEHYSDLVKQLQWVKQYKEGWWAEAHRAALTGEVPPLPHAQHINFCPERGVVITGPTTADELHAWTKLKKMLLDRDKELASLEAITNRHVDDYERAQRAKGLQHDIMELERLVPSGWNARENLDFPSGG